MSALPKRFVQMEGVLAEIEKMEGEISLIDLFALKYIGFQASQGIAYLQRKDGSKEIKLALADLQKRTFLEVDKRNYRLGDGATWVKGE